MTWNNSPKTFDAGVGGVVYGGLVKLSGETVVLNTITSTDDPIGISLSDALEEESVAIAFLNKEGTMEMLAAGAISYGDDVYAAAGGAVSALPGAAADYKKIGIALEDASGAGAVIEVLPYDYHKITTVS